MAPPLRCPSVASAKSCANQLCRAAQSRSFSSTSPQDQRITRARESMFRWLNSRGSSYLNPAPDSANYLSSSKRGEEAKPEAENDAASGSDKTQKARTVYKEDLMPFPKNPAFISEPILSEEAREDIWKRIMQEGQSVREVSASLGVEMRRVGAVVRLMEIEKEWLRIGKPLAKPYAKAVMSMLPRPRLKSDGTPGPHESINDVTLHAATSPQIFYPTSESRYFTRADAARVFDENLLPADDRVPHPELTLMHKDHLAGLSRQEVKDRQKAREGQEEKRRQAILRRKAEKAAAVRTVDTERWQFRFTDINVEDAGKNGRGRHGVGWRYGAPLMDRKKGTVWIPTKVE